MFLRLISDVPKLLLPRVQLSWLLAQPQSLSSSSHATGRAGIWECPKETSPACTQVVGQDREVGTHWRKSRLSQSLCELAGMGRRRLKAGIWLWSPAYSKDLSEGRREQQQVPLPRVCPAGEFFLSWLKYSRKTSDFHHTFSKCAVAPRGKGDV